MAEVTDPLAIAVEALRRIANEDLLSLEGGAYNECRFCLAKAWFEETLKHHDFCLIGIAQAALARIQAAKEAQRG